MLLEVRTLNVYVDDENHVKFFIVNHRCEATERWKQNLRIFFIKILFEYPNTKRNYLMSKNATQNRNN